MIPLIGYADRLSVRPGDTIDFKVSSDSQELYQAELVRVRSADPNPAGPGIKVTPVAADFAGSYASRVQTTHLGSYAQIDWPQGLVAPQDFTLLATVWPTLPGAGPQTVLSCFDLEGAAGVALALDEDGAALAICGDGAQHLSTGRPLRERSWYRIWMSFNAATGRLTVGQRPLDPLHDGNDGLSEAPCPGDAWPAAPLTLGIAATLAGRAASGHFNGKIERPQIFQRVLTAQEIDAAAHGEISEGLWAGWDFSQNVSSLMVQDVGPHGLHGNLINLPARAMIGSNWSGREMCWRHAPGEYGAIHFHNDDIYDCGWETDFSYQVPDDLPSGCYAAHLTCGDQEDTIPFFVCPPKGTRRADLCVVISSFTYVIYGNHERREFGQGWRNKAAAWDAYPWNPGDHGDYGLSTYNFHEDGSGICHASRLRPLLSLRVGYFSVDDAHGSGLRHFQADMHLLDWLEAKDYDFDLVTDDLLHEEGAAALEGYRCVLTCSHPEYHTRQTLDALENYRDGGGRLVYLGGNGFYWRVALHQEAPGVLEIRRAEGGIRAWAAEPGEYYNAFDGAYGGLWRRNGRPPQRLAGVGFSAQGIFEGSYYRRRPEADDPRAAWLFAGVADEVLGDFGLSGGGAAGFELDRADVRLGTPEHALVVASSEGHNPKTFVLVPEEQLTHVATWSGERPGELIRADLTFFEAPNDGAVLSVGSITFCGSLSHDNYDNNIGRILGNAIDRFLDPEARFPLPQAVKMP